MHGSAPSPWREKVRMGGRAEQGGVNPHLKYLQNCIYSYFVLDIPLFYIYIIYKSNYIPKRLPWKSCPSTGCLAGGAIYDPDDLNLVDRA